MTVEQFIKKAIEGGYNKSWFLNEEFKPLIKSIKHNKYSEFFIINFLSKANIPNNHLAIDLASFVLIPEVWQAVGNVHEWKEPFTRHIFSGAKWQDEMHRMIDTLCEGKSIEEFLETL